jgi:saccharopine dehydrogenase-like NADP-dependent oxidoreductase
MRVAIFGAGKIGSAVSKILTGTLNISHVIVDENGTPGFKFDLTAISSEYITELLKFNNITHIVNALPFHLNEKVATAAFNAGCNYIDFTEDDAMSDKVQEIYKNSHILICATKCGLAPGFVNYIGYDLVRQIEKPNSLIVSVGALPRNVSFSEDKPADSYNLSWSVDGLVNEYIRPCRVRHNGKEIEVKALTDIKTVILDGTTYEYANTSGGVGSLLKDLSTVPNIAYKTMRYPGHYKYVSNIVKMHNGDFEKIKQEFLKTFPYNDDDVIVVYAEATGTSNNGQYVRRTYSNKIYGSKGLTGIQATTAASGTAILEMMIDNELSGVINHKDISLYDFKKTESYKAYYK